MKLLVSTLAAVALIGPSAAARAEAPVEPAEPLALVISGFHQATELPLSAGFLDSRLQPGLLVGVERPWASWNRARLFQTLGVGFFRQVPFDAALFASSEIGASAGFDFGLSFEALLGLGYAHGFSGRQLYSLETGEPVTDWGVPSLLATLALGVEYDLRARELGPVSIFARYQPMLQWFPRSRGPLAVTPRASLHVGVRVALKGGNR